MIIKDMCKHVGMVEQKATWPKWDEGNNFCHRGHQDTGSCRSLAKVVTNTFAQT